jgi:hypothetical protein
MKPERFKHLRRFSLRTLFVLMTVCCLLAGAWSVYVNPFRLEQQSLAAVNRLQGNVAKTSADGPAWQRWLVTKFLGDDAFVHVTQVDLSGTRVDDKELPSLSGLTHLEKLNLDNTQVTDDGTAVLRVMHALKDLSLRYTNISDRTAAHLTALAALQTVTLTGAKITDAAVDDLAKHAALKELYIRWTRITNPGADRLRAALPNCAIHFHALQNPLKEIAEIQDLPVGDERRP